MQPVLPVSQHGRTLFVATGGLVHVECLVCRQEDAVAPVRPWRDPATAGHSTQEFARPTRPARPQWSHPSMKGLSGGAGSSLRPASIAFRLRAFQHACNHPAAQRRRTQTAALRAPHAIAAGRESQLSPRGWICVPDTTADGHGVEPRGFGACNDRRAGSVCVDVIEGGLGGPRPSPQRSSIGGSDNATQGHCSCRSRAFLGFDCEPGIRRPAAWPVGLRGTAREPGRGKRATRTGAGAARLRGSTRQPGRLSSDSFHAAATANTTAVAGVRARHADHRARGGRCRRLKAVPSVSARVHSEKGRN